MYRQPRSLLGVLAALGTAGAFVAWSNLHETQFAPATAASDAAAAATATMPRTAGAGTAISPNRCPQFRWDCVEHSDNTEDPSWNLYLFLPSAWR